MLVAVTAANESNRHEQVQRGEGCAVRSDRAVQFAAIELYATHSKMRSATRLPSNSRSFASSSNSCQLRAGMSISPCDQQATQVRVGDAG